MRRIGPAIAVLVLAAGLLAAQEPPANRSEAPFQGPEVSEAGELANTSFIGGVGIAVLEPVIGDDGNVESVNVIRSTPGLESWAVNAVKTWKFRPATMNGQPARSKTTVVIVFNRGFNVPPEFSLPPLAEPPEDENRRGDENGNRTKLPDFAPALPTDVVIPEYPIMSVLTTTVVLRVAVTPTGDVDSASPLRDVAAYSRRAMDAIKKWQFSAATFGSERMRSNVTVAVLFVPPPVN